MEEKSLYRLYVIANSAHTLNTQKLFLFTITDDIKYAQ